MFRNKARQRLCQVETKREPLFPGLPGKDAGIGSVDIRQPGPDGGRGLDRGRLQPLAAIEPRNIEDSRDHPVAALKFGTAKITKPLEASRTAPFHSIGHMSFRQVGRPLIAFQEKRPWR